VERRLFDVEEVAQYLLTRSAADSHLGNSAVPAFETLGERGQGLEATPLQGVGFDVATTPLGRAVHLFLTVPVAGLSYLLVERLTLELRRRLQTKWFRLVTNETGALASLASAGHFNDPQVPGG
jgi:hypothetical protein